MGKTNLTYHLTILLCFFSLCPATCSASYSNTLQCSTKTYSDSENKKPSEDFEAGDKIYLKIFCNKLQPGQYTAKVYWSKENYGVIRTDKEIFTLEIEVDREIFFWMKLDRRGFLNRLTSLSDYNPDMLGSWTVESYMDEKLVGKNQFTIY